MEDPLRKALSDLRQELSEKEQELSTVLHSLVESNVERERLLAALQSSGSAVVTTDREGRVAWLNRGAAALLGWQPEIVAGRPLAELLRSESWGTPCSGQIEHVLSSGAPAGPQVLPLLRTEPEQAIAERVAPIRDACGQTHGVVMTLWDMTEYLQTDQSQKRQEKLEAVGRLAGGLAHEFNNVLHGLLGYVQLAHECLDPRSEAALYLDRALTVFNRARDLTHQLLVFSKGGKPIRQVVCIQSLVFEAVECALCDSNVRPSMELSDDLWPVDADPGQIRLVINNIVTNARQAMPTGGTVAVTAANVTSEDLPLVLERRPYVRISIQDHGPGIQREHQPHIFDPFFSTRQGTGLGLATSYSIVRRHGGTIEFESIQGFGTTFHIYLPASTAPRSEQTSQKSLRQKIRALVMDDDPNVLSVIRDILLHFGHEVECARDGQEAIAAFVRAKANCAPFDLLILDLTVAGGLGGQATLGEIKRIDPNVKAIVSSGYSDDPAIANPKKYGFAGRLAKPFQLEEFETVLGSVLESPTV